MDSFFLICIFNYIFQSRYQIEWIVCMCACIMFGSDEILRNENEVKNKICND